jgi:cytochrome P450
MLYIITSPWVYQHLLSEILLGISQNRISQPIRDSEAKTLPYLQACIKEGLRMYPPGAGIIPKEVQKGGDTIAGVYIPEGTKVGYCAWGVYKNKETFGQDADMFRPERWLETSGEELARMNSTWDLIFSPGKWQCLGKSVALMELNKVFVEVSHKLTLPYPSFCLL